MRSPLSRQWSKEFTKLHWDPASAHRYGCKIEELRRLRGYDRPKKCTQLDMLLVNRRFFFAGIDIFYKERVLAFNSAVPFASFIETTGLDRRSCVQHVAVEILWVRSSMRRAMEAQAKVPEQSVGLEGVTCQGDEIAFTSDLTLSLPRLRTLVVNSRISTQYEELPGVLVEAAIPRVKTKVENAWANAAEIGTFNFWASPWAEGPSMCGELMNREGETQTGNISLTKDWSTTMGFRDMSPKADVEKGGRGQEEGVANAKLLPPSR